MFAIRRASNPLKNHGVSARISVACSYKLEISRFLAEYRNGACESIPGIPNRLLSLKRFHYQSVFPSTFSFGRRSLSSEADSKRSEEDDDSEDGELEIPPVIEGDEWKFCESDLSDDDRDVEAAENAHERLGNALSDVIICKGVSIHGLLDKWVEEGNEMGCRAIELAIFNLRERRMYGRALQVLEWLEKNKKLDFNEWDYARIHLDLIARIHGIFRAEIYLEKIPESYRGEVIYRTFLAYTVKSRNSKKAEETFNKMKNLGFPLTTYACNQLLLVYKRADKKKIADVLLLMDKENIKPNLLTCKLLIDMKGESNDIIGMEKVAETMKAEKIRPDFQVQAILARHYINAGHKEKAMVILKAMEGEDLKRNRGSCRFLLTLYAALGSSIDVERIWKFCETSFSLSDECKSAIEAWGKLNKVKKAEAIFNEVVKTWKISPKHYYALLKIYVSHRKLTEGEDLVRQMAESGYKIGPLAWDALVKLYIGAGNVSKADNFLRNVVKKSQFLSKKKPMVTSYIAIMDHYSKEDDFYHAEDIFRRMRQETDYVPKHRDFHALIKAYVNGISKLPNVFWKGEESILKLLDHLNHYSEK